MLTKSSHFRAAPAPAPAVAPKPSSAVKRKAKEIASSSKGAKKPKLSTAGKNLPAATAAKQKKPAASKIPSSVSAAPAKTVIDVKPGGEERGTAVKAKKRPITVAAPIAPTAAVAIDRPATVVGSTKAAAWVRAESAAVGQQDTAKSKSKPTAGALAAGKGVPSKSRGGAFTYPTPADLKFFRTMYAPIADPLATSRDELLQFYADHQFTEWLALLDLNQSLYLHGVGSQERLLRGFVKSCLAGEDVLQLSCGMDRMYPTASAVGGRQQSWHNVVLNLLRIIANEILSKPLPSSVSLAASASTRGGGRARGPGVLDQLDLSVSAVTAMLLDESLSLIHKTEIICGKSLC